MTAAFMRDGLRLLRHDSGGDGPPIILQHGLCGAVGQITEIAPHLRKITLECRGHGGSEAGPVSGFSIATFAEDVIAGLCPAPRSDPQAPVLGGISMGAAIATRIAVMRPALIRALILIRPAWIAEAAPDNMIPNLEIGRLLAAHSPDEARARFEASETAARLRDTAPDNLASLLSFCQRQPIAVTAALLTAISLDGPGISRGDLGALRLPTLVIGHDRDAIHPLGHARTLAALIPNARLVEITPKATDKARYLADLSAALTDFVSSLS